MAKLTADQRRALEMLACAPRRGYTEASLRAQLTMPIEGPCRSSTGACMLNFDGLRSGALAFFKTFLSSKFSVRVGLGDLSQIKAEF